MLQLGRLTELRQNRACTRHLAAHHPGGSQALADGALPVAPSAATPTSQGLTETTRLEQHTTVMTRHCEFDS
jgi:hypothetical protein